MAAVAALLVVGLLGALALIEQRESSPAASTPPAIEDPAPAGSLGQFVWPAPARGYGTLDELITGFATEVLEWDTFDISDGVDESLQPQVFTISNAALETNLQFVAIPSPDGWGFVQIGNGGLEAGVLDPLDLVGIAVEFPVVPDVTSNSVAVRRSDGTTVNMTTASDRVELPDMKFAELVTVLVVGVDNEGQPITAIGGGFNINETAPPDTEVESEAPTDSRSSDQQANDVPVSTVRIVPTTCPPVTFEFGENASELGLTTTQGTSDRDNTGFQLSTDLSLFRLGPPAADQGPQDDQGVVGQLRATTQDGYETTVYPAAFTGPGPIVTFRFPADSAPNEPCATWSIGSQDPDRAPADLVVLVEGMQMSLAPNTPEN